MDSGDKEYDMGFISDWSEAEDYGNGEIYDYSVIEAYGADSVESDLPIRFEPKTPWYAARAGSALEVVAKMELGIVGVANWRTGLEGCLYNDFIFVTPCVRGRVYAIGRGCIFDHQIFATMSGRFRELLYFSSNSWARSQDGQLTRYYSYATTGVSESVGEFTAEEIKLGFDQFVEPGHGFLCRPVGWGPPTPDDHPSSLPRPGLKSQHNDVDSLTLCSPMSDPDPTEIERLHPFFLPHRPAPDEYDEVRWPLAPPPGWAESHAPYDDSYIESYADLSWIDGQLSILSPRGKQIFDAIYQACVATGWYATASYDDVRLVFTDESFNHLRLPRHDEATIWIDSAEDLRAFHGERDFWKCGFTEADMDVCIDKSGRFLLIPTYRFDEYDPTASQPKPLSWDSSHDSVEELGKKVLKCLVTSCDRTRPLPGGGAKFAKTRPRVHVGTRPAHGPLAVGYIAPGKNDPDEWTVRLPLDAGPTAVGQAVVQVLRTAGILRV